MQTTAGPTLQALKAMQPGPTDFAVPDNQLTQAAPPRQVMALADPSNYGDRYLTDINGQPVQNDFIAVLHETVGSAQSALNLFRTYHPRDQDQVSYHALIGRDGTVYYIVPPEKRAFGAGNSVFDGPNGPETVRTNAAFPPSVNNFAYHISLETPGDGFNNQRSHSGYTQAQYNSLAWLLAQTTIPDNRITTHKAVDRSGNRMDPRSFNSQSMLSLLRGYSTRTGLSG
jgi:N-acetyl-anhydromuramyl-L-alanine amidase AmpD